MHKKLLEYSIIFQHMSYIRFVSKYVSSDIGSETVKKFAHIQSEKFRNMGILAHIDAGKTTTTERMLFYSGEISSMGNVDDGTTVTDYMSQERSRGITITSAAVSMAWKRHRLNLIDTPGHIDFTIEVERCLRILDGAIIILDAVHGVQAQTVTVWKQSERYNIPRLLYINKMDREKANIEYCIETINKRLNINLLKIQLPIYENKQFCGIIDVINMVKLIWNKKICSQGSRFTKEILQPESELFDKAMNCRISLIEQLADLDEEFGDLVLQNYSLENMNCNELQLAIRRITLCQKGFPLLFGSSLHKIGVQPLMDSVIMFLPSPLDLNINTLDTDLSCIVFKIIFHPQKGTLTFIRIYSGHLYQGQKVYSRRNKKAENILEILIPFADQFEKVEHAGPGSIVAITGLKNSYTGDMLFSNLRTLEIVIPSKNEIELPSPVFFCNIEASSIKMQKKLEDALSCLQREDPSLNIKSDPDTGMGELHLDIAIDRLIKEYHVECYNSKPQIAFKETITTGKQKSYILSRNFNITLSVKPSNKWQAEMQLSKDCQQLLTNIKSEHLSAIQKGISNALSYGPLRGYEVVYVQPLLNSFSIQKKTSESMITAAAMTCMQKLSILVNLDHIGIILHDLSTRKAVIEQMDKYGDMQIINCKAPLSTLLGYATIFRTLTSGSGNFNMHLHSYQKSALSTPYE